MFKKTIYLAMVFALGIFLLNTCSDEDTGPSNGDNRVYEYDAENPEVGVWYSDELNGTEVWVELDPEENITVFMFGLVLEGTYNYDATEDTLSFTISSYTSMGSDISIEGSPFPGEATTLWTDITITEGSMTMTSENDEGEMETNTLARLNTAIPLAPEDHDVTLLTVSFDAADIAGEYVMAFASPGESGPPSGIGIGQLDASGAGDVKAYIPNSEFGTETTLDCMIMGGNFDPTSAIFGDGLPLEKVGFAGFNCQEGSQPDSSTVTKDATNNYTITCVIDASLFQ